MAPVKIVTDSTADLSPDLLKKYDISMIPLKVNFGTESYKDQIEIKPEEFYKRIKNEKSIPSTSQPSPGEIYEVFKSLADQGHSIISIHISSHLSGTYQAALLAKSMLPDADIHVIDSGTVSVGLGLLVLEAAKAAAEGKSMEDVINVVKQTIPNIKIYFIVDTLEYLAKGGRIGHATAFLGTLLNIKPLLVLTDGVIYPVEKIRGRKKAINRLVELIKAETEGKQTYIYAADAGNKLALNELVNKAREELNYQEMMLGSLGPVVGCHSGPEAIGIAFFTK
ncbi:MAG: DegV family protein [Desulfotomaculum sp.]|nr:DegV family protein [Desulfotomaculum sp.]